MSRKSNLRIAKNYSNILARFAFIILAVLTVKLLIPSVSVNTEAASQTATQTVGPYTMSMSDNSNTDIEVIPNMTQTVYTGTDNLSISNTCTAGATVFMTMESATSNSLIRTGTDSFTKEIVATTTTSLDDDSWGYALNNSSTYHPVPKNGQTAATIYDASTAQTSATIVPVKFGVKTDINLPSGDYSNTVVYTMVPKMGCFTYTVNWNLGGGTAAAGATYPTSLGWGDTVDLSGLTPTRANFNFLGWSNGTTDFTGNEAAADLNPSNVGSVTITARWESLINDLTSISNMQDTTNTICSNTAKGTSNTLTDIRDNNTYEVTKLNDGNCWMMQNLRLINRTLTSADSNVTSNYTIPNPKSESGSVISWTASRANPMVYESEDPDYGVLYNYVAATAGTITGQNNATTATSSVCPKGWRLPTQSEWVSLFSTYQITDDADGLTIALNDISLVFSGTHNTSGLDVHQGNSGYWWSATAANDYNRSTAYIANTKLSTRAIANQPLDRRTGTAVRCIAE